MIKVPRPQFQNVKRGKTASSSSATGVDTTIEGGGGIMSLPYQKKGQVYDVMTGEAITTTPASRILLRSNQ